MSYASYVKGRTSVVQHSRFAELDAADNAANDVIAQAIDAVASIGNHLAHRALAKMRERATVSQLSALSDQTLHDIGLERRQIRDLARHLAEGSVTHP